MGLRTFADRLIPGMAARALDLTRTWIGRFGGRLAGSEACARAAEAVFAELQRSCGTAVIEHFRTHPSAFNRFYRIDAGLYLAGLALLFLGRPFAAGLVLLFMIAAAGAEFGWYLEFYDWLYPEKTCQNVTATLEPDGEAQAQLIISGHHDSALELSFLRSHQKLYGLRIIIPDEMRFLGLVTALGWVGWRALAGGEPPFLLPALILLVLGIYPVMTKFFLFGKEAVPGAGDNLIATAMLAVLAERFADPQHPGRSTLKHTRLVFASFDAEESGLRGSRAWVSAHRSEIARLPTTALNIDSIYKARDMQFLTTDLNSHVPLDKELVAQCLRIAASRGIPAGKAVMRFGGGATDAAELARAGARATTMIAMPAGLIRDGLVYHTMQDTVDAIEPEAVAACLTVIEELANELDRNTAKSHGYKIDKLGII